MAGHINLSVTIWRIKTLREMAREITDEDDRIALTKALDTLESTLSHLNREFKALLLTKNPAKKKNIQEDFIKVKNKILGKNNEHISAHEYTLFNLAGLEDFAGLVNQIGNDFTALKNYKSDPTIYETEYQQSIDVMQDICVSMNGIFFPVDQHTLATVNTKSKNPETTNDANNINYGSLFSQILGGSNTHYILTIEDKEKFRIRNADHFIEIFDPKIGYFIFRDKIAAEIFIDECYTCKSHKVETIGNKPKDSDKDDFCRLYLRLSGCDSQSVKMLIGSEIEKHAERSVGYQMLEKLEEMRKNFAGTFLNASSAILRKSHITPQEKSWYDLINGYTDTIESQAKLIQRLRIYKTHLLEDDYPRQVSTKIDHPFGNSSDLQHALLLRLNNKIKKTIDGQVALVDEATLNISNNDTQQTERLRNIESFCADFDYLEDNHMPVNSIVDKLLPTKISKYSAKELAGLNNIYDKYLSDLNNQSLLYKITKDRDSCDKENPTLGVLQEILDKLIQAKDELLVNIEDPNSPNINIMKFASRLDELDNARDIANSRAYTIDDAMTPASARDSSTTTRANPVSIGQLIDQTGKLASIDNGVASRNKRITMLDSSSDIEAAIKKILTNENYWKSKVHLSCKKAPDGILAMRKIDSKADNYIDQIADIALEKTRKSVIQLFFVGTRDHITNNFYRVSARLGAMTKDQSEDSKIVKLIKAMPEFRELIKDYNAFVDPIRAHRHGI